MKFNTNFDLKNYMEVVDEIVGGYFDSDKGDYTPHYGRVVTLFAFCNHCVELEDSDELKAVINDIKDINDIISNKDIMDKFYTCISSPTKRDNFLSFKYAYQDAMSIVEYKKNDSNMLTRALLDGFRTLLNSIKESIPYDDINEMANIFKGISGEINADSIVKAYEELGKIKLNKDENKAESE